MNNILYLIMDRKCCVDECIASLKSLEKTKLNGFNNTKVTIYTNLKEDFKKLISSSVSIPIEFRDVSENKRNNWIGEKRYVFRSKICTLIDFLESGADNAIFVDTDTFFINDCDNLFKKLDEDNTVLMNYLEHSLPQIRSMVYSNQNLFFYDLYQNKTIETKSKVFKFDNSLQFFNSGVIGIKKDTLKTLYESLIICDAIFEKYGLFTTEQVALSCAFWNKYLIEPSDKILYHYWFMKEARYLVEASLCVKSAFEIKHTNTPVIKYLQNTSKKIEFFTLKELIRDLFLEMDDKFIQSVYGTITANTNLGRMLRK